MSVPIKGHANSTGYFLIAFGLTWLLVTPIGASYQGWIGVTISGDWHFLGALGPLVGALVVGRSQRARDFLSAGWVRWRVSPWFYLAALSPLLFLAPAAVLVRLQEGAWPNVGVLADSDRLADGRWLMAMLVPALAYAVGEETGWRGFALPRLQALLTPFRATLLLAGIWVLWHTPFYLYRPGMEGSRPAEIVAQAVIIGLGAFFLTWLYNSTGGSILLVAIWHFTHSIVHIAAPEVSLAWETWNGVFSTILAVVVTVIWWRSLTTRGSVVTFSGAEERAETASSASGHVLT